MKRRGIRKATYLKDNLYDRLCMELNVKSKNTLKLVRDDDDDDYDEGIEDEGDDDDYYYYETDDDND